MHIETSEDARQSRRHAAGGGHDGSAAGGRGYFAAAASQFSLWWRGERRPPALTADTAPRQQWTRGRARAAYRTSQKPERNDDRGSGNGPAGEEALGAGGSEAAKLTTVKGTGHPNSGENGSKRRVWRR